MRRKANRHGTLVYTEQGPDAKLPDQPQQPQQPPEYTGSPQQVLHSPAFPPEPACPHGGLLLHNIPVCGHCNPDALGLAILHIARKVSQQIRLATVAADDIVGVVALALYSNHKNILTAQNPTALAFTIARRAAKKAWLSRSVNSMAVGWMNGFIDGEGNAIEGTTEKLGYLDGLNQLAELDEKYRRYLKARELPGLRLLWTDHNFRRLQLAIDEGKRLLPKTPCDVYLLIDMRLGLSEGMAEYGWQEIADQLSPSWDKLSPRRCRDLYDRGLALLRDHIIRALVTNSAESA
jgi:hypothetical protein